MANDADVVVVGAGLAGLVAANELADAGKRVIVVDQEGEQNLGGQAFWSLGGLFLVDTPEQRRLGIKDSHDLALQDWMGTAGFDRSEDNWPRKWAEAYVAFCAAEADLACLQAPLQLAHLVQLERGKIRRAGLFPFQLRTAIPQRHPQVNHLARVFTGPAVLLDGGLAERVRMLGGTHSIESEAGKGTTAKVIIPLREEKDDH